MPNRTVMFCVAHSSAAVGAVNDAALLNEYTVSLRASLAAVRSLAGEVPVEFFDCGPIKNAKDYLAAKVAKVNACSPALVVEIHCNSSDFSNADYSEVIYHRNSVPGAEAASVVAASLAEGFTLGHHKHWQQRGARPNTEEHDKHLFYFLEKTNAPALIIEGVFISNDEQARWLVGGGQEAYGLLVAEGVRKYMRPR